MMIAAPICVISLATMIQFAISQWRSVWLTIAAQPLSKSFEAATGIAHDSVGAGHFEWLVQVSKEKFPSPQEGHSWLKAVGLYRQGITVLPALPEHSNNLLETPSNPVCRTVVVSFEMTPLPAGLVSCVHPLKCERLSHSSARVLD